MSITRLILIINHMCFCKELLVTSRDSQTASCVVNIIETYYEPKSQLTYMEGDNVHVLPAINQISYVTVLLIDASKKIVTPHSSGYLIVANNYVNFVNKFNHITTDFSWNPNAKMLIVFKNIDNRGLRNIFDRLLKEHVLEVVILNDTVSVDLYTYNPYENFACGTRYDRIIRLGHCNKQLDRRLFYSKLVTGLENCKIRVVSSHLPPYSIDPARNESEYTGIEQFILKIIGEKEKFSLDHTYQQNVDEFTVISANMSAVGPMSALQRGEADVINGAMLLTYDRAQAFAYLTVGDTFTDYLQLQVASAKAVSNLQSTYSGFHCLIWLALLCVFLVYSALMYLIIGRHRTQAIVLKMFGYLLLQSSQIRGNKSNRVFIFWVFFAYLINCYYQSSLVSITTQPHLGYQIATVEDIVKYNLKPCVSISITRITDATVDLGPSNFAANNDKSVQCEGRMDSIRRVAEANDRFTIYPYSLFKYNEYNFYNEFGKPNIYTLSTPKAQILYAIYLYKGFPMWQQLQKHCQHIEEGGLLKYHFGRLITDKRKKQHFVSYTNRPHIFIPWYVLGFGITLSTLIFSIEVLLHKCLSKYRK